MLRRRWKEVLSPLEGKFFLIKNASDTPVKVGDVVKEGDVLCYVEAMKTYNAVRAEFGERSRRSACLPVMPYLRMMY